LSVDVEEFRVHRRGARYVLLSMLTDSMVELA
jgi:hypothetical protein